VFISRRLSQPLLKLSNQAKPHGRIDLVRREEMKQKTALIVVGLILMFGSATRSEAQVKRVQMHIAGYLCGN